MLIEHLNSRRIALIGIGFVVTGLTKLGLLIFDVHFLDLLAMAVWRTRHHAANQDDLNTLMTVASPLLAITIGAVAAYFGRPLGLPPSPPSSPGPDSGVDAHSARSELPSGLSSVPQSRAA